MKEVKLSRVERELSSLSYPISRAEVAAQFDETTLLLADGECSLASVVEATHSETYVSADDLEDSLFNALPREAVGEPFQSEGEG